LRQVLVVKSARRDVRQLTVERVNQKREGQVTFELGRAPREHHVATLLRARCELREQARLTDPGFAAQPDRARRPALDGGKRAIDQTELVPAPYQYRLRRGHDRSVTGDVAVSM